MSQSQVVDRLRRHTLLGEAPDSELEWLVANGEFRHVREGVVISRAGQEVEGMFVVLSGLLVIHLERSYGRRKAMEWHAGDVTGVLPYSRMGEAPGDVQAVEPTDLLVLPAARVRELPALCPSMTASLVHAMTDRARRFNSADLHDQRTLALGKVAAGLAHELNNPASALIRVAKSLKESVARLRDTASADVREEEARAGGAEPAGGAARAGGEETPRSAGTPDPSVVERVQRLFDDARQRPRAEWSPLERSDREQAIEEWIESAAGGAEVAAVLADSPLALSELFGLVGSSSEEAVVAAVCRAARFLVVEELAGEVGDAAGRVFELVSAVKRLSHLDQVMGEGPVDLNQGLQDAVALFSERARKAGVNLTVELAPDPPPVRGVVEELNQVWQSLLDNAVEAAAPGGKVRVSSQVGEGRVCVEFQDDGPGIPADIRDRIFDPFFTTKPVGQGAGLGLALVRRVVDDHRGVLEVRSRPGETVFRVELDRTPGASREG